MGKMQETYIVGPRRVSKHGRRLIVALPKDFEFLHGKKVYLTIEVWEPPSPPHLPKKQEADA